MKNGIFLSRKTIAEVIKFADNTETRQALCGLWVDATDPQKPIIEATDGHRLHRIQADDACENSPDTFKLTKGHLKSSDKRVVLSGEDVKDILFKLKEIEAISKMHRGPRTFASGFKNVMVKFSAKRILFIAHDKVLIRYIKPNHDLKEVDGAMFGINTKYFIQALENFVNKVGTALDIEMLFEGELNPVIFKPVGGDYPFHMLMPVKLYPKGK